MSDTTEPMPVIALQYHQDDEHAPWLAVVRLLCILSIIGNGTGGVLSAFNAWNYLDGTYRTAYSRSGYSTGWIIYVGLVQVLGVIVSTLLVLGAAGCLRRMDGFRRFTVTMCWGRLVLGLLVIVGTIGMYASRASLGMVWLTVPQVVGRELGGSATLSIAVAVVLARPEVLRAFAARGGSITP